MWNFFIERLKNQENIIKFTSFCLCICNNVMSKVIISGNQYKTAIIAETK